MLTLYLQKLHDKESLSRDEAQSAFDAIFMGTVPEQQIGDFLLALHDKGETTDEIQGAVISMRGKSLTIAAPKTAIDIVGTGGDGQNTLNISTAAAIVTAACGVPVAKHGNRAATSKSGSSDVLAMLGVNLEPSFETLEECLHLANLCFLFAPRHHPAMSHVVNIRRKLGVRTIFNLLGPLTNPAEVKFHLIGVYADAWLRPMAEVLQALGSKTAWFTHGEDGLDELTTSAPSHVVSLNNAQITEFKLAPDQVGIPFTTLDRIQGGNASENAAALTRLMAGEQGPYRDIVLLNVAAALVVAGKTGDIYQGVKLGAYALESGTARGTLQKLIELTNRDNLK
jgi:anthranilate phosphoribosyltransferase